MSDAMTVTLESARQNIGAAVVYEPYPGGPREDGVIRGVSQTVVWVHYSWQRCDAACAEARQRHVAAAGRKGKWTMCDNVDRLNEEIERLHTWSGLMGIIDEHYPGDVVDGSSGDPGPRIVALLREVAALRDADRIVTELCDEYGVERSELVDRLGRDRLVMMAFDETVREETARLRDAGEGVVTAAKALCNEATNLDGAEELHRRVEAVVETLPAWRSAAGTPATEEEAERG